MDIAELAVILTAKIDDLAEKMEQGKKHVSGFEKHASDIAKSITKSFLAVGAALGITTISIESVVHAVKKMVEDTANFNKAMTDIQAETMATGEEMGKMAEMARQAGTTTLFSATEASKGLLALGEMGLSTAEDMSKVYTPSLNLAMAAQMGTHETATLLMKTLKSFNMDLNDAGKAADVFAKADLESNASTQELAMGIKSLGPIAKSTGASFEDLVAIVAGYKDVGLDTSQAGFDLRIMLSQLTKAFDENGKATSKAGEILREHGITHEKLAVLMQKPVDLLKTLREANLSTGESVQLFGARSAFAMNAIMQNVDATQELRDKLLEAGGTAEQVANVQMSSLTAKAKMFQNGLEEISLKLGDRFIPFMRTTMDVLIQAVTSFANNKESMDRLGTAISVVATIIARVIQFFLNFGSAVKFSAEVVDILGNVLDKLTPSWMKFGSAMQEGAISKLSTMGIAISMVVRAMEVLKTAMGEKWNTAPIGDIDKAFQKMKEEMDENGKSIDKILDSLKNAGDAGSFIANLQAEAKESRKTAEQIDIDIQESNDKKQQMYNDLLLKIYEVNGQEVEANKLKLAKELDELKKAGNDAVLIKQFEAARVQQIQAEVLKSNIKSLQNEDVYLNASWKDRVSMLKDYAKQYQDNVLFRREIETELQKATREMNQETFNQIHEYVIGPLSEGFKEFFKAVWDGTATSQKFFEAFGKSMLKSILKALAQVAEGYAIAAIAQAASKGVWGLLAESPAIIAASTAAAALEGLASSFAQGGIVGTPGLAMVGDTSNKSPEVIAPLDKLQEMMQPRIVEAGGNSVSNTNNTNVYVNVEWKPTMSFASPTEARRAGQEIIRVLQDYGYGVK